MRLSITRACSLFLGTVGAAALAGCGDDETSRFGTGGNGGGSGSGTSGGGGTGQVGGAGSAGSGGMGSSGMGSSGVGGSAGDAPAVPSCGSLDLASLGTATWDARFTVAGVTGHDGITPTVYDFAVDADGSVLATGRFAYYDGDEVTPLLRLRDGAWRPAHTTWTIEPRGDGFAALSLDGTGTLALATADSFGERTGEIWLDRDDEQTVVATFSGQVRALAWLGGRLYAAGAFELASTLGAIANLAVWDGEAWSAPTGGAADGPVLELHVSGGSLYVGGAFASIGGIDSANVAMFDGLTWTPLPLPDALAVYALARTETGDLYAGGALGDLDAAGGVVRRVGDGWEVVGGGLAQSQTRGVVSDLLAHDGVIDASGCFQVAGGLAAAEGTVSAESLARWNGETWTSLHSGQGTSSPWFQPGACGDESVLALWDMEYQRLAIADGKLFAGGSFAGLDGVQTQSLAVRENDAWVAQGRSGLGLGGSFDRIVAGGPDCEVYGLGAFTHLGGEPNRGRVARFDADHWQPLTDDLPLDAYCPALDVSADGVLAIACLVFSQDGTVRSVVLSPGAERLVELELDAELPPIQTLKWSSSGKLWLGGGESSGFIATAEDGHVSFVTRALDGVVQLLDVRDDDDVLAAGLFTSVEGTAAQRIVHYANGEWQPIGDGLVGQPLAIGRGANTIYASTFNEGQGAFLLGAFDGNEWRELAGGTSGLAVEDFYSFNQILPVNGGVLLVGTAELQDGSGRGALLLRDGKLEPIGGGGVHGISVSGVALAENALWVAGVIAEAAGGDELVSSVGVARLAW